MNEIFFQERILAMVMLARNKEFYEIPVKRISEDDQKVLRHAYKICRKSGKVKSDILEDCELICDLGKITHQLNWFEESEAFFRTAVEKNPNHSNSWYNFGLLLKTRGKADMAEEMFRNALAFAPTDWDKRDQILDLLGHSSSPRTEQDSKLKTPVEVHEENLSDRRIPPIEAKTQIISTKAVNKTGKCAACGKLVGSMAYVCRYCGHEHCQDHRLPENHSCGPEFRPIKKRELPTSNEDLVKEIARIGEIAANKAYIDISIKNLSEFDEKVLKHAFSVINVPNTKAEALSDDFELWFRAGKLAQRLSWPQVAERFYRIALEFGTEVETWQNLGKVLEAQGKVPEAEDAYRKVTVLDPENADAWMRLGNLYEQEGRQEEARVAHNTCFKQDPQKAREYLENRPWEYYQKLEPETVYQKRVEEDETDAEAWFALGTLRLIKRELPAAEQAFRTGLKYDSKNSQVWNTLGCVLLFQQQIDRGEKCYRQAIDVDPDNWHAHYNLGLIHESNDRTDAAIEEFQICSELIPREARAWVHLCLLLKTRGRIEESKAAWDKISVLAPWIIPLLPDFEKISHFLKPYKDPSRLYT